MHGRAVCIEPANAGLSRTRQKPTFHFHNCPEFVPSGEPSRHIRPHPGPPSTGPEYTAASLGPPRAIHDNHAGWVPGRTSPLAMERKCTTPVMGEPLGFSERGEIMEIGSRMIGSVASVYACGRFLLTCPATFFAHWSAETVASLWLINSSRCTSRSCKASCPQNLSALLAVIVRPCWEFR